MHILTLCGPGLLRHGAPGPGHLPAADHERVLLVVPQLPEVAQEAAQKHPLAAQQPGAQEEPDNEGEPGEVDKVLHEQEAEQHRHDQRAGHPQPFQLLAQPRLPEGLVQPESSVQKQLYHTQQ